MKGNRKELDKAIKKLESFGHIVSEENGRYKVYSDNIISFVRFLEKNEIISWARECGHKKSQGKNAKKNWKKYTNKKDRAAVRSRIDRGEEESLPQNGITREKEDDIWSWD